MSDRRNFINFRAPDDLVEALDAFVKAKRKDGLKLSRAQAARLLIEVSLRDDTKTSVLTASLQEARDALKKVASQLGDEMGARAATLLAREFSNH